MKFGLTVLFILSSVFTSLGAIDSVLVKSEKRGFDQQEINSYKADSDFSYIHANKEINWLDGFYDWFVDLISGWFKDTDPQKVDNFLYIAVKVLLWALLAFAVGMLIYSLYKNGAFGLFGRKKQVIDLAFSDLEDKVLETDWQELINQAVINRQFNVAVRLLYLQLLQSLNSTNQIKWDKSKSIRDYQRELDAQYHHDFTSLSRYYQYSWFGDIIIDETHFNTMLEEFKIFTPDSHVE